MAGNGPLQVAIVGCGNISRPVHQDHGRPPWRRLRLVGAYDLKTPAAEALVKEHGGRVYETLDQVLADPAVETVVNLTIHQVHYEVIKKCLEAGKHVHTEKPLTLDTKQAHDLVKLAKAKGVRPSRRAGHLHGRGPADGVETHPRREAGHRAGDLRGDELGPH